MKVGFGVLMIVLFVGLSAFITVQFTGNVVYDGQIDRLEGLIKDKYDRPLRYGLKGYRWRLPDGDTIRTQQGSYGFVVAKRLNGRVIGHGTRQVGSDEYWMHFYRERYNEWQNDQTLTIEIGYMDLLGRSRERLYFCTELSVPELLQNRDKVVYADLKCDIEAIR